MAKERHRKLKNLIGPLIPSLVFALANVCSAQTKTNKPAKAAPSISASNVMHHQLVELQLSVQEARFETNCAQTAKHEENVKCASRMLSELRKAYEDLTLLEIPLITADEAPSNFNVIQDANWTPLRPWVYDSRNTVWIFRQETQFNDLDKLTITVYETENNTKLYTASRTVLVLGNDLTKLIKGYRDFLVEPAATPAPSAPMPKLAVPTGSGINGSGCKTPVGC